MGNKHLYAVKEIEKLLRRSADLDTPVGIGGGAVLAVDQHDLEGPEHSAKSGALLLRNVISPAQLVANTDNWAPTDLATADVIRVSTDASRNLTGITAPSTGYQAIVLENVGAFDLVLKHDVTSTAANRFLCPNDSDMTLQKDSTAILVYDIASTRWRVVGGGGGGGAGVTYGTPAIVLGTAAADGSIDEAIRRDSTIVAFDATVPTTQAFGDAAAVGSAAKAARRDHKHAMMADPVPTHVGLADPHTQYALDSDLTAHAAAGDPHPAYALDTDLGLYVPKSLFVAKGSIAVATAASTPANLAVGANGRHLVARSSATEGVAWEIQYGGIAVVFDGGGTVLTTGNKGGDFRLLYDCTLVMWTLEADVSGSVVVDIWKKAYGLDDPPTVANTIIGGGGTKPTLSSHQSNTDSTLTGYTVAFTAGDVLRFNIDSITTCKRVTLTLKWSKG